MLFYEPRTRKSFLSRCVLGSEQQEVKKLRKLTEDGGVRSGPSRKSRKFITLRHKLVWHIARGKSV